MKLFQLIAAGIAVLGIAIPTAAASLTVSTVDGFWSSSNPSVSGLGTSEISWGVSAGLGQSGYTFETSPVPFDVDEGDAFVLGTFEHLNNPVWGPFLESADLAVEFSIAGVVGDMQSVFSFNHWETVNNLSTCANGEDWGAGVNSNGCADRVTATLNLGQSESFVIDGLSYVLDVIGFQYDGQLFTDFWTVESAVNSAELIAVFRTLDTPPSEVPLPASGLLLLGGIAGLAAARRRKS